MAKQNNALEWEVLLSDAEWGRNEGLDELLGNTGAAGSLEQGPQRPLHSMRLWNAALAVLVMLGITAFMLWRDEQANIAKIESARMLAVEKKTSHEAENRELEDQVASGPGEEITAESITSGWHRPMEDNHVLAVWQRRLQPEVTAVGVTTVDAEGHALRETHFFREEVLPNGLSMWQRISPSAELWGQELHVETTHFTFWYQEQDADAVEEAAVRLDAIYDQLRIDLGLPEGQERLEVHVLPVPPAKIAIHEFTEGILEVTSPKLMRVPLELSDGDIVLKAVVDALTTYVMNEIYEQDSLRPEWMTMARGLQLWEVYVGSNSQAPWFYETAEWLYDDAEAIRNRQRVVSTGDLHLLCREFDIWRHARASTLSLPALCTQERWDVMLQYYLTQPPARLDQLLYDVDSWGYRIDGWFGDWQRSVAAATLIDYVTLTYGRERLPALVAGLRTHSSWTTLIPDVFGVSAEKFETRWRRFHQID